jgi:hypothetical protein
MSVKVVSLVVLVIIVISRTQELQCKIISLGC